MDLTWAQEELSGIELRDARLEKRAAVLLDELSRKPSSSIPIACGGWGETLAAYRFLGNEKCQWADILAPHTAYTLTRMAGHPVVLCLQDTTVLDFNGQKIEGLGPLSYEAQRGMFLHPTLAVTPGRLQLGLLDAWMWAREFKDKNGVRPGLNESIRWVEGYERVAERALELPETRLVYVADREGDLLPLMQKGNSLGFAADILVRSKHNRVLAIGEGKLWDQVGATAALGQIEFLLPGRKGKPARQIKQELRVLRVKFRSGKAGETFEMTAILAREINTPAGEKPVEWRLLTNRDAKTLEEAAELIDWYRCRWEIEQFFNVLKNGCKIEELQLSSIGRIETALAFYLIIAWRVGYLLGLGKTCPDMDCEVVFAREEWQAAWIVKYKTLPQKSPTLNEMIRLIAGFGGFLGRKCDKEPGAKSLWQGLQSVMHFAIAMQALNEANSCV
jgi:hypothetical protein